MIIMQSKGRAIALVCFLWLYTFNDLSLKVWLLKGHGDMLINEEEAFTDVDTSKNKITQLE